MKWAAKRIKALEEELTSLKERREEEHGGNTPEFLERVSG